MSHPFLQDSSIFRPKKRIRPMLSIITTKPMPQLPWELWNEILLINRKQVMKERIAEMQNKIHPLKPFACDCGRHIHYNKWGDKIGWGFTKPILATNRFYHEYCLEKTNDKGTWSFWKYRMCATIDIHAFEF